MSMATSPSSRGHAEDAHVADAPILDSSYTTFTNRQKGLVDLGSAIGRMLHSLRRE